jgi:aminoglycoside phosphotransferase (APT) family kinase protein
MTWQMPTGPKTRGLAGVDRSAIGLPSDDEFVAQYCERRGIGQIDNFGFYLAFCFFRFAAIVQGVYKRALDGNASNPEAGLEASQLVNDFAEKGVAALDS